MGRPKGSKNKVLQSALTGKTFNKWQVLERYGNSPAGHPYYTCRCVCGRERPVRSDVLVSGVSKSCGCSQFERFANLYKKDQQYCPQCKNWLPLEAFTKYYHGKVGEPCRECRRVRRVTARAKETREEKRARQLKRVYGLSLTDFYQMAIRQHNRCLGCQEQYDPLDLVVDHNHSTGIVRGLLCNNCNSVLGMVKESEEVLYRLSAYLVRDPRKTLVYIVGSLRNPQVLAVANKIREDSRFDVFDDYMAAGPEGDDYWKRYETQRGHDYVAALKGRAARHVFNYDKAYIDMADVIVVVFPAGKSCMMEAGYSRARGKTVLFLLDETTAKDRHDVMSQFATDIFTSVEDLCTALKQSH